MVQNLAQPNQFNVNFRLMRGVGVFFLLSELVLAIFLYKERGTFMDVSFQTFEMSRTHALAPEDYRF
jgi:hypothetical protein